MEYQNITDNIASKYLGKRVEGENNYNPSLLVAVPRFENRKLYGLENGNLPFLGADIWQAYEFSAMTENCIPVSRVLKLKYSCENDYIVESKSLKLYLNSFNMDKFGQNTEECLKICKDLIEKDLSEKLQTRVEVEFLDDGSETVVIFSEFVDIMNFVDESNLKIEKFKEAPELLTVQKEAEASKYYLKFGSLRSNCRVTHQPDFGDVYIYYNSRVHIDESSLVKYLVSFRSEYHFHEECCEMIYKRLYDLLDKDDELCVCALYTRRGGIDISPVRYSKICNFKGFEKLLELNTFARAGIKQ